MNLVISNQTALKKQNKYNQNKSETGRLRKWCLMEMVVPQQ